MGEYSKYFIAKNNFAIKRQSEKVTERQSIYKKLWRLRYEIKENLMDFKGQWLL